MDIAFIVLLVIAAAVVVYFISTYNRLVTLKHNVGKAWSNIDVLLKQRHDELPKLVETCRRYMRHEQETLEKVMRARAAVSKAQEQGDVAGVGAAEGMLRMGLGNLYAVAEQYPDLKADGTFQHLQARISELENTIADRREFYNESANLNNIRIEQFPDVIVARTFNFESADLLEFEAEEISDVDIRKLFD